MKTPRLLLALLCGWMTTASAERAEDIPTPLPTSYVADPSGLLAADTRAEIDRLAIGIDDAGRGQLTVVVVANTGGVDPRQFATNLFNRWGVGHAEQDDGTLILLAREDRAAEIVLGTGIDTEANRAHAQAVMANEMVPRFKQGDYDQAMVAGANAVLQTVYATDMALPSESPDTRSLDERAKANMLAAPAAPPTPIQARRTDTSEQRNAADSSIAPLALGLSILAGIVGAVGWVLWKILQGFWWLVGARMFPRSCSSCKTKMNLLGEAEDDALLTPEQRTEERLKSVNHRVFVCPGCSKVDKLTRRAWFSSYANCKHCGSRAVSRVSKTLTAATRYSTGLAEVTETCEHCHHIDITRQTIARLPPPSSSSSSSSSGGRSFGGGSSRGGGASGRW